MNLTIRLTVDTRKLETLGPQARARASQIVRKTAYDIVGRAQADMSRAKSGRMYGAHRASAPGESPAVDTGALKASIAVEMDTPVRAIVNVGAEYGLYLELGTRWMAARPFLRPAVQALRQAFAQAMRQVVG